MRKLIAACTALVEGPLAHVKITRRIVSPSHPDHVGLAGWIVERCLCARHVAGGILQSVYHQNCGTEERRDAQRCFSGVMAWTRNSTTIAGAAQDDLKRVVLPRPMAASATAEEISIGNARFKVITCGGHALDQVMLYCAADNWSWSLIRAPSKISPTSASGRSNRSETRWLQYLALAGQPDHDAAL